MKRLILLQGCPRSGKDTSLQIIKDHLEKEKQIYVDSHKFSSPLKRGTHEFFGIEGVSVDFFEDCKDIPQEVFFGMTPREAYIEFSERCIKTNISFGKDFFGKVASNSIAKKILKNNNVVVVTDFGFKEEFIPLLSKIPPEQMVTIQLERDGHTFADYNDSRTFVDVSDHIDQYRLVSNTVEELKTNIIGLINGIFK